MGNGKMNIKEKISEEIIRYVKKERDACALHDDVCEDTGKGADSLWGEPLVGFADAKHPYIRNLKQLVHPQHQMPEDVIPDARVVIVYFVPFNKWFQDTNTEAGLASPEWAEGYELTNAMMARLNKHIIDVVCALGYNAAVAPEAGIFYRDEVMSHWSFRHFGYAAGLGTFGLNNMLITEKGCAGRLGTVVTNLDIEPGGPQREEACLYKRNGSCGACVKRCPSGALTADGFDRHACYEQCLKNAQVYDSFGSSYTDADETAGSEVCGKCVAGMPCALKRPL